LPVAPVMCTLSLPAKSTRFSLPTCCEKHPKRGSLVQSHSSGWHVPNWLFSVGPGRAFVKWALSSIHAQQAQLVCVLEVGSLLSELQKCIHNLKANIALNPSLPYSWQRCTT
jgi:hypothetical protein